MSHVYGEEINTETTGEEFLAQFEDNLLNFCSKGEDQNVSANCEEETPEEMIKKMINELLDK